MMESLYILICSKSWLEKVKLAEFIYVKSLNLHEIVFIVSQNSGGKMYLNKRRMEASLPCSKELCHIVSDL